MQTVLFLIRLFVGLTFVTYGLIKVLGGQFVHGDFVIDSRTTDPTGLVWGFFGYSPVYARFVGLCELVPGLLLLVPRTRTLGAVCLLPVTTNITVMDFCFGFPAVKYFSLLLTVLCAVLVASDYRKLKLVFWDVPGPVATKDEPAREGTGRGRLGWLLGTVAGLALAVPLLNLTLVAVTAGPEAPALAYCARQGWDPSGLAVRRWQRTQGDWGVGMEAFVEVEATASGKPEFLRVRMYRPSGFVGWQAVGMEKE